MLALPGFCRAQSAVGEWRVVRALSGRNSEHPRNAGRLADITHALVLERLGYPGVSHAFSLLIVHI